MTISRVFGPRSPVLVGAAFMAVTLVGSSSARAQFIVTLTGAAIETVAPASVLRRIQPVGLSWELFGSLHDIFDQQYSDPASSTRAGLHRANGRTARIGLRWSLRPK